MQEQVLCCHCTLVQLFGRAVLQFLSKSEVFKSFYMAALPPPSHIKTFTCALCMYKNANQKENSYINYRIVVDYHKVLLRSEIDLYVFFSHFIEI